MQTLEKIRRDDDRARTLKQQKQELQKERMRNSKVVLLAKHTLTNSMEQLRVTKKWNKLNEFTSVCSLWVRGCRHVLTVRCAGCCLVVLSLQRKEERATKEAFHVERLTPTSVESTVVFNKLLTTTRTIHFRGEVPSFHTP